MIEILTLFAGAILGEVTSECRQWAHKKAGEANHDIQKALLKAHQQALDEICEYCQRSPEWRKTKDIILSRINNLKRDGLIILELVETGQSPGSEGGLARNQQQDIAYQF